ncbi:unnamed protein product [Caenorhabditis bovis]|uniref:C3H1-type domain-containing protein n=1 Tax=Caenorhabditis bovis TaxID=2654633 RepID=A0A8S1F4I1_9PELO|nr:unnamed protein product [Caenorhabditis bovis]
MQTPSVSEQFLVNAQCDPNFLAYQTLYGYPKTVYPSLVPSQLPHLLVPAQTVFKNTKHCSIPDLDKLAIEEPIEAGSLNYRKSTKPSTPTIIKSDVFHSLFAYTDQSIKIDGLVVSSLPRRHSPLWETMTDDERESVQRQKRKEEAFKTALCDSYKRIGSCPYGNNCRFAHGENELRMPLQPRGKAHPKYKTQLCDKFSTYGQCPYGPRCQFIHKLKKGLPLLEYNRALAAGAISPARDEEIVNPDESDLSIHRSYRRRSSSSYDLSDSGYGRPSRRNLSNHLENEESKRRKVIYPPMQVVNIEMATANPKSSRRSLPAMINQEDYQAAMANGKMYGKLENIRGYSALVRGAAEETSQKVIPKKELSLIREEDTISEKSQSGPVSTRNGPQTRTSSVNTVTQNSPWYEKIFGKKMTVIRAESTDSESYLQHETTNGMPSDECNSNEDYQ